MTGIVSNLLIHLGALVSEQHRIFSCWPLSGGGASLPRQIPAPCGDGLPVTPLSLAGSCLRMPDPPTPGLSVSAQSKPTRLGPAGHCPSACFSDLFILALEGPQAQEGFPGFTPAQTLCPQWCGRACAHRAFVPTAHSHPLSKASGDFLALPSECPWDLTPCCQAACLFPGLGCPRVLGLCSDPRVSLSLLLNTHLLPASFA